MNDLVATVIFAAFLFTFAFLFKGDPDLWDKGLIIAHQYADEALKK